MKRMIAGMMLMAAAGPAAAESGLPESYTYVGIHGTQLFYDTNGQRQDSSDLDSALLPGLQIGHRFSSDWSVQALYETGELDAEQGGSETDLDTAVLEARRHLSGFELAGFEPYAGLATGHHEFSVDGNDNTETLAGIGVGLQRLVADNVFVDVGARHDFILDNSRNDTQLYVGVNYAFGDANDGGAAASARTTSSQPTAPQDSDNDGVADSADKCLDTPEGTPVNDSGCEIDRDSDGDGIVDREDQCPDTQQGAKVDERGCHVILKKSVRETLNVRFETASARVTDDSIPEIREVAEAMREYPESTLVLEGHTDSVGNAEANRELSERRAQAVKQILVERMGIDANRIVAEGYGESKPIAENDTPEGRARNRRVESVLEASKEVRQ